MSDRGAVPLLRLGSGLILAYTIAIQGCTDASGPLFRRHLSRLLVPATEEAAAVLVDLDRRQVVLRIGPPLLGPGPALLIDNSSTMITSGRIASGDVILAAYDTRTGAERWEHVISRAQVPLRRSGVALGLFAAAAHSRRPELFMWRSERDGVNGLAVFDYRRGEVIDFFPFSPRPGGVAFLSASARYPDGAVIGFGDDGPRDRSRAFLYFLAGAPLKLRDSLVLSRPSGQVWQVQGSPDGRELLVGTDAEILRVDVANLQIVSRARRPNLGPFIRSPTDGRVFFVAPGALDVPSPDIVHILSTNLELTAVVDLRALPTAQRPLGIGGGVVSRNGRWLYIVSGVARDGPLYGPQPTSVLLLNLDSLAVSDVIPLRTLGGGVPMLVP